MPRPSMVDDERIIGDVGAGRCREYHGGGECCCGDQEQRRQECAAVHAVTAAMSIDLP
jgi:hypothetical protein